MKEIYKQIVGYEGIYEVSNTGKIRSVDRKVIARYGLTNYKGRILKPSISRGYYGVNLFKRGKIKRAVIHKIVAIMFLENPENLKWVNHKDGNKLNNNDWNLEWCTPYHNIMHAIKTKLNPTEKIIFQLDMNGNFIREFESLSDASKSINKFTSRGCISMCCTGKRNYAFGYKWKYKK